MRLLHWNRPAHRHTPKVLTALALVIAGAWGTITPTAYATAIPGPAVGFTPSTHDTPAALTSTPAHTQTTKNVTSSNEAGYASTAIAPYTEVSSTWVEPNANCGAAPNSYASFWTGLDGYNSASVEQTGTLIYCSGTTAYQYAWYEMYPAAPVYYNVPVTAGDRMTATVTSTAAGKFTLVLSDATKGWTETATATNTSATRSSAEIIVESSPTGTAAVADFGTVTFTNSTVNSIPLASAQPIPIANISITCSPISGGGTFTCTWHHP